MGIMQVPVPKAKASLDVDTDKLPEHVYAEALRLGLKEILARGMTKITVAKLEGKELADAQAAALAKAESNLADAYSGKVRIVGATKTKVSGAVNTEAMRIARNVIKEALKAQGKKVSHYPAKAISDAAKALLATDDGKEILAEAKTNVEARSKVNVSIDLSAIAVDPKLVAKAEQEKEDRKAQLSAKQAGQTKKRPAKVQANA